MIMSKDCEFLAQRCHEQYPQCLGKVNYSLKNHNEHMNHKCKVKMISQWKWIFFYHQPRNLTWVEEFSYESEARIRHISREASSCSYLMASNPARLCNIDVRARFTQSCPSMTLRILRQNITKDIPLPIWLYIPLHLHSFLYTLR